MRHLSILALLFLLLVGCSTDMSQNDGTNSTIKIYTSIYPIQYVTEQIAGGKASVTSIFPPGVDAHTYEPATKEMTAIADGDVFFYLGAGMESFASSMKDALESQPITFISIEENNPELFNAGDERHEHEAHNHSDLDPHVWLDPMRMIQIGELVRDELIEQSPEDEAFFHERFDVFKNDMQDLDKSFQHTLANKKEKDILVTHAAYGYWEDQYDIHQIAISGISSSDEPSQKELASIAKLTKEKKLQYVIFEQNNSNKVASIIQKYIGADKLEIHNLEVLTEEDAANNEDYISLMKQNLEVLDKATK